MKPADPESVNPMGTSRAAQIEQIKDASKPSLPPAEGVFMRERRGKLKPRNDEPKENQD